jgi:hypothetical protein
MKLAASTSVTTSMCEMSEGDTVFVIHFEDAVIVQRGDPVLSQASFRLAGRG